MSKTYYVYLLLCSDETYYTGFTSNIDMRLMQHQTSYYKGSYTSSRLPVELVWYELFSDPYSAIDWEKRIKSWSKVKKKALINGEFEKLPGLSKKKFN
jgi:putative endonuclease